jgi:hypothetical protein
VRAVEELKDPEEAPMLLFPCVAPVAIPEALMVATLVFEDVQITELVRFCLVPSLNDPSAMNCWFCPAPIEGFVGVIASDDKLGGSVAPFGAVPPPHPLVASNLAVTKTNARVDCRV